MSSSRAHSCEPAGQNKAEEKESSERTPFRTWPYRQLGRQSSFVAATHIKFKDECESNETIHGDRWTIKTRKINTTCTFGDPGFLGRKAERAASLLRRKDRTAPMADPSADTNTLFVSCVLSPALMGFSPAAPNTIRAQRAQMCKVLI